MTKSDFDVDEFLAHYGVLGMKWGVRKDGKPQGYQGPSKPGMGVARGLTKDFGLSPTGIVTDRKGGSKPKETQVKDEKHMMSESTKIINSALTSPALSKTLNKLNNKYQAKGPYFSLSADAQMDYAREYMSALRSTVGQYSDPSSNMRSDIDLVRNSKTNQIEGFVFFYGDQPYVDSMMKHSDEPKGVRRFIEAITDPKTGYITKLKVQSGSLKHYGVKGMKWGVRKDRKGKIRPRSTITRRDNRQVSDFGNPLAGQTERFEKAYGKVYSKSARKIRKGVRTINKSDKYKGKDFRFDSPLRRSYYDDMSKMMNQQLNASSTKVRTGRYQLNFDIKAGSSVVPTVTISRKEHRVGRKQSRAAAKKSLNHTSLSHADSEFNIKAVCDSKGYVVDLENLDSVLDKFDKEEVAKHFDTDGFLAHHGVKGMKWGVRKDGKPQGHQGSGKKSSRFNIKKSAKPKRLRAEISNKSLREANERMRLEIEYNRNVSTLRKELRSRPEKTIDAVKEVITDSAKKSATQLLSAKLTQVGAQQLGLKVKEPGKKK